MQNYEITYLTKDEDNEKIVSTLITEHEGKVTSEETLGKKRLAYPIKKEEFAIFYTIKFTASAVNAVTINNLIQGHSNILRHLIVTKKALTALNPERKDRDIEKKNTTKDTSVVAPKPQAETIKPVKAEKPIAKSEKTKSKTIEKPKAEIKKTPTKSKISKKTTTSKNKTKETEDRLAALDEKLDEILKD